MSNIAVREELEVYDNIPYGKLESDTTFFALRLALPNWHKYSAGQFVMISPKNADKELTWARPLSICRVTKRELVLFFQVVGRGTKKLAELKSGDKVVIWGPLGNGFHCDEDSPTLLLAGGIGIAPFLAYVENHTNPTNLNMVFGHRMPIECYPIDSLLNKIYLCSLQEKSKNDLLSFQNRVEKELLIIKEKDGFALACGPMPFLKFVHNIALTNNIRVQLSLENKMACGIGACLGCVAKSSTKWKDPKKAGLPIQTCTYGPVFWAEELDLGNE